MVYQFPACTSLCKFWVTRQFRIQWYTGPKTLQMRGHCKIVQTKRVFQVDLLSKSSWLVKSSSLASEAIFSSVNVGFGDEFWKLGKSIFSSSTEFAGGTVDFSKDAGISVVLGFSWLFPNGFGKWLKVIVIWSILCHQLAKYYWWLIIFKKAFACFTHGIFSTTRYHAWSTFFYQWIF